MKPKYIFVTGGVCSSLGKGIAASSIGALIEAHGYKVNMVKIDPYLNVDAGTMSPLEHGEVYVTHDGGETDLDLGNYERFTHHRNDKRHSITTGQIYQSVIEAERQGQYLGKCIQLIPHLTNEVKRRIQHSAHPNTDVTIIEIGGTVGDIESTPFLEAARQLRHELGPHHVAFVHVTFVPLLPKAQEFKTKPTQHSVQTLRAIGIQPDILLCRIEKPLPPHLKEKIALFTQVQPHAVIQALDCPHSIYEVPLQYHQQNLSNTLLDILHIPPTQANIQPWENLVHKITHRQQHITIALVGKYVTLKDADLSVREALHHAGFHHNTHITIRPIPSEHFTPEQVQDVHGILIPGGFGPRGIEGMIAAATHAQTHHIPYLGICLGMQTMVIAHARHAMARPQANSTEFDLHTPDPVVDLLATQKNIQRKGGTMRLGTYTSKITPHTRLAAAYGTDTLQERHRHRYEINNAYIQQLTQSGLAITCMTNQQLIEAVEWTDHPFGIGVQYHPELQSKPMQPHPLFSAFVQAALQRR